MTEECCAVPALHSSISRRSAWGSAPSISRRAKRCCAAGGAKPIAGRGGLEGFTPPHRFKARTAASDGHCASTRAARSAGLRFAVRSLSEAIDREISKVRRLCWHLIHRCRGPPSPRRGRLKRGLKGAGARLSCTCRFMLSGLWSLVSFKQSAR